MYVCASCVRACVEYCKGAVWRRVCVECSGGGGGGANDDDDDDDEAACAGGGQVACDWDSYVLYGRIGNTCSCQRFSIFSLFSFPFFRIFGIFFWPQTP